MTEHAPDVGQKSHVEHAIRFVEHEKLEARQPGVGCTEMIEQPAGSADDDVDAAAEGMLLRAHADTAEHRGRGERRVHGEGGQILGDLRGELPGRRQHERACRAAGPAHQLMQNRQEKRGGLAASGHRTREQVASL